MRKIEVIELGEDGEHWLVLNTKNIDRAVKEFNKYEESEYGLSREEFMTWDHFDFKPEIFYAKRKNDDEVTEFWYQPEYCKECGELKKFEGKTVGFYINT